MIVFDASTLVSATLNWDGVPARAVRHAMRTDRVGVSRDTMAELLDVLYRPRLVRLVVAELRAELLGQLQTLGASFAPSERVADCRDPKDDKYLELALASGAGAIVSSDQDLLVLHPWRGVRILRPADYLSEVADRP